MFHYKIQLETGKKKNMSRTLFVRAKDIIDAMAIGSKVRYSRIVTVVPITYEEYMEGVDKKYSSNKINF